MISRRLAVLGFAAVLAVTAGCPAEKKDTGFAEPVKPTLSANPTAVLADGIESTIITVSTGRAPVTLTTTRGTFSNGAKTIVIAVVPGTTTLTPCDARVVASCAGVAVISAQTDDAVTASMSVVFDGFENCGNGVDDNGDSIVDCADPQCPLDMACSATGLVCSSTQQCNKCTVPAGGVVESSLERTCTDTVDNDCDGDVDCADSDCLGKTCNIGVGAPGVCNSAGACVCDQTEASETTCGDNKDNDCDGVLDCNDPDCLGKTCNSAGMQCTGLAPSTCAYCPTSQVAETGAMCGDGKDNDCDGTADCYDTGCQPTTVGGSDGQVCSPFGGVCKLTMGVPSCGCSTGASTESSCSGGVDDDCDGLVDCEDPDCQPAASGLVGPSCGPNGRACTAGGECACPGGDVELCNNYDLAGLPVDDNCDGKANCLDTSCRPTVAGAFGEDCSGVSEFGKACDATGTCACTGNGGTAETAEATCDDAFDNDCDFLIDCQDDGCDTRPCGPGGAVCSAATRACVCPGSQPETGARCQDGLDNDCNGKIDCEEPSCASALCSGAQPTYICISSVCSDPATQYGVKVTPVRPRIPADGAATTSVTFEVTYKGAPKAGVALGLALQAPVIGSLSTASVTTDSLGKATATFTSTGAAGVQTIVATVTGIGAQGFGTVTLPSIGEIRILDPGGILYPVMGVKTSGFQEQNQLVVEILDTEQKPYPDGLAVVFTHQQLGGSTLSDPTVCVGVSNCVTTTAVTDSSGLARVRLYSGTVAGVIGTVAQATAGGIDRLFQLPSIAVVGAKPNAGHFSVVCGTANVPAYADYDCHVSRIDAPFTCAAFLKDRYNNLLGRETTVSFMSEAGAVGPPAVTPPYDPDSAPTSQPDLGTAVDIVNTLGAKLPKDVVPNAGEESIVTAPDSCGVSERNPRDGVVTVVAWTPGEEAFFDSNGNGTYDTGEPFIDLPEPFVDYDDDDTRDGDEPFIDTDGDGLWTDVNGLWDASTNIWTKTLLVYTGMPAAMVSGGDEYAARWMEWADAATYPLPTPIATFAVRPSFPADDFVDCNGNASWDAAAAEPYTDCNGNGAYDAAIPEPFTDADLDGAYTAGENFADCNGNGIRDASARESFTDCNGNGTRDAAIAERFTDYNGNGVFNALPSPPTSESLVVTASDRNLNRLAPAAKYEALAPSTADYELTYGGEADLPDRLGFSVGYQPCNAAAPASCALDCADVAPPGGHCVMRTRVSDFTYGYRAGVTISGSESGVIDGATEAFWDLTLFNETLRLVVSGTHQ